jgi:hypothetical protein
MPNAALLEADHWRSQGEVSKSEGFQTPAVTNLPTPTAAGVWKPPEADLGEGMLSAPKFGFPNALATRRRFREVAYEGNGECPPAS